MKVLQINKYPSPKGGTETVLFDTIKLLKEKGHDVVLFSTDEGNVTYKPTYVVPYPKREDSFSRKISKLPSFFYNKDAARRLEAVLEYEKPDIAHIHLYLNGLSVSVLPVLKRHGIPVVMTLHDYREICPSYLLLDKAGNICKKCEGGNYLNCMLSRCAKGSLAESALLAFEMYYRRRLYPVEKYVDRFVCVSDFMQQKCRQFNPAIAGKSVQIDNPVNIPETIGEKEQGAYLLYFGRLSHEKGIDVLIKAMEDFPGIHLKIAGAGTLKFEDVPAHVEFLGFKRHDELRRLIDGAMFTLVPSCWYETFGLSCAESLSQGTPVIASRIGALPEVVKHGENGFLFSAGDVDELKKTIKEAVALPGDVYRRMSENARESVLKLSGENYICKLLAVYNGLYAG